MKQSLKEFEKQIREEEGNYKNNPRDDYHTMEDLYDHRLALTAALVSKIPGLCVKSKKHDDGTMIDDHHFIIYIETPKGQVSYHYNTKYWDLFKCRKVDRAPKWDKHTPNDVVNRLKSFATETKTEIQKSSNIKLIIKAKPYPDGTIRNHGKNKYRKQDGGWIPVKDGLSKEEHEKMKNGKKEKCKVTVKGTKDIYEALDKVINSKSAIYLDDLEGDMKKICNILTKEKLLTWVHVANDEYKAELTEAGKRAYTVGHALYNKLKRETNNEIKEKVREELENNPSKGLEDFIEAVKELKRLQNG